MKFLIAYMLYTTIHPSEWFRGILSRMQSRWTPTWRSRSLLALTLLGLLSSVALTHDLWTASDRTYPLVPILEGLTLSPSTTTIVFVILFTSLGAALVFSRTRAFLLTIGLIALGALLLADITRLQPWVFHYGATLLLITFALLRQSPTHDLLDAARILVAGIYFWSGLQKLNRAFMSDLFPRFTEPLWSPLGEFGAYAAVTLGLFVPFLEAAFGAGLLFKRTRTVSLFAAGAMLVIVLASIGPFGHNWNSSVWPWNIVIFATAFILFFRTQFTFPSLFQRMQHNFLAWIAVCLFWVLPIGNVIGLTDHYLAWSLYSGRVPVATIAGEASSLDSLLPEREAPTVLPLVQWAMADMNAVPYPEPRVFVSVFAQLCQRDPTSDLALEVRTPYYWHSTKAWTRTYTCADM